MRQVLERLRSRLNGTSPKLIRSWLFFFGGYSWGWFAHNHLKMNIITIVLVCLLAGWAANWLEDRFA